MAWTYDVSLLATSSLMQVRRLIGDVIQGDQQFADEEINWQLSENGSNIYLTGAECCRLLATKYSRDVDLVEAELRKSYAQRSTAYSKRALELDQRANLVGGGAPYAGGISISDKQSQESNADRVPPQFNIGMFDNWLPVAPTGNETEAYGQGTGWPVGVW